MFIEGNFTSAETYFSPDLSGMAKFFLKAESYTAWDTALVNGKIPDIGYALVETTGYVTGVDLIIDNLYWPYSDTFKLEAQVGNTFHIHYLGMDPITATITGSLIDYDGTNAKKNLMFLYQHAFRMTAIAAHKIVPTLECLGYFIEGGITSLEFIENAFREDVVNFNIQYQVFRMEINGSIDNKSTYTSTIIEFIK